MPKASYDGYKFYSIFVSVKFAELDKNIKHLAQRLKEGSTRDTAQNKVASITEKLGVKAVEVAEKPKITQKMVSTIDKPLYIFWQKA